MESGTFGHLRSVAVSRSIKLQVISLCESCCPSDCIVLPCNESKRSPRCDNLRPALAEHSPFCRRSMDKLEDLLTVSTTSRSRGAGRRNGILGCQNGPYDYF